MSLATLQTVEQQLAAVLDAALRHLQAASALDTSVPCSADVTDQLQTLAGEIERLQTELQAAVASVVTQSRHKRVLEAPEAPTPPIQEANVSDEETETEDEAMDPKLVRNTQKEPTYVVDKEKMAATLQRFVQFTCEGLETDEKLHKIPIACSMCRGPTANFVKLLQAGEPVDEASACLYRDTLVKVADVASGVRASGRLKAKPLLVVLDQLEMMLTLAGQVEGAPAALKGDEVRTAQLKLKTAAVNHAEVFLTKMHKYVENVKKQKKGPSGGQLGVVLKKLIPDLQVEMVNYTLFQKAEMFTRTEERWAVFAEVAESLGDWIGRMAMTASPPKVLGHMFRAARRFDKEFPGRVPSVLLTNAGMRFHFNRQQERANKKGKGRKGKKSSSAVKNVRDCNN